MAKVFARGELSEDSAHAMLVDMVADAHRAAIEKAAKVCEDYTREHRQSYDGVSHSHCESFGCGDIACIAIEIRALSEPPTSTDPARTTTEDLIASAAGWRRR
jgi:hypothetical protein